MIEYSRIKKIHFIGIGGAGMSGIAEVLHNMGFIITGSDIADSEVIRRLNKLGIKVFPQHSRNNIKNADTLVFSSAINKENVEVNEALKKKIPVISRAEMLAELMRVKFSIAVSGTHGKTSTTFMIASILNAAQKDPTFVVGGKLQIEESGAKLGKSDYLIAEADESDGSFLRLFPTIAVITNIEDDHLDYFKNMKNLLEAFGKFGNRVPFYGSIILNLDCLNSRKIIPFLNKRILTYSLFSDTFVRAEKTDVSVFKSSFELIVNGTNQGEIELGVGGQHNLFNALAAISTAIEIGIDIMTIKEGLKRFHLPERRFQVLLDNKDYLVIDDYAHHPTEVKVIIDTLKEGDFKRIIVVFQPHRFTRLKILMDSFVDCFSGSSKLVIARLYAANQQEITDVSGQILAEKIKASGFSAVLYIDDLNEIIDYLMKEVKKGDAIAFLSAGNLTEIARNFSEILGKEK